MTAADAAKLLDLSVEATPEQLESRFLELRRRLEDRIAKAPTPGLQAKYRASLAEITVAFETLTLAADASLLPMLSRASSPAAAASITATSAGGTPAGTAATPVSAPAVAPKRKKSSSGKEFILVAILAVLVLGAAGWYVMHMRAEKAERLRVETEQRIAAEKEAAEKAAAAAAEADRLAKLATQLRTAMAEQRVNWEAIEGRARDAERRTSELKSELRGLRDAPAGKKAEMSAQAARHTMYLEWQTEFLARHPAKLARARAEEFLNAKAFDEAVAAVEEMAQYTAEADTALTERMASVLDATGAVHLESQPTGLVFEFTDTYGAVHKGTTPADLTDLPLSHVHHPKYDGYEGDTDQKVGEHAFQPAARFLRAGWQDIVVSGRISPEDQIFRALFPEAAIEVNSTPAGLAFEVTNRLGWKATGKTPATVKSVPPGVVTVKTARPGYKDVSAQATLEADKTGKVALEHRAQTARIKVAEAKTRIFIDGKLAGTGTAEAADLSPGEHKLQLELSGYSVFRTTFTTVQEVSAKSLTYSFAELAQQNITCSACNGNGSFARSKRCDTCGGDGRMRCVYCDGSGKSYTSNYNVNTNQIEKITLNCFSCGGRGTQNCNNGECDGGIIRWTDSCERCGGDGRRSKLELQ